LACIRLDDLPAIIERENGTEQAPKDSSELTTYLQAKFSEYEMAEDNNRHEGHCEPGESALLSHR
jgi:hypothetical protein